MLQIYSTLSRTKEVFEPLDNKRVRMYVCGMTVYDYCHLGHARVMVTFDVISRYLRQQGYQVTYVRNITDIDDKIIQRANENNESSEALTARFIDAMHQDELRLQNHPPDQEPKATAHIQAIIDMIQRLLDKKYAYAVDDGDVYFRVSQFADYGKLSNKKLDDLQAGARVDVAQAKEDARDFVLWKRAKQGEPAWNSPWGAGRPGWHIECSAMSTCCLGESFDIHGGGPDLVFPHHENEIAQSEAATGKTYAKYWMHAGAVRVDDEKMSKSLGNFFTIREILDQYHPEVVRYFLIASHYRSAINYTEQSLYEAKKALTRMYTALRAYESVEPLTMQALMQAQSYQQFTKAMNDDFNTPQALAVLFDLVSAINQQSSDSANAWQLAAELKSLAAILGLLQHNTEAFLKFSVAGSLSDEEIDQMVAQRVQAKQNKNYQRADEIRAQLTEQGVVIEDSAQHVSWRRE